mmetsp:Transcript_29847/g.79394  ORF Transcript_29847/g.79394 Transcript_29847/m.79394 type:complete len:91 (-) Transcript_29847:793-1065(-)
MSPAPWASAQQVASDQDTYSAKLCCKVPCLQTSSSAQLRRTAFVCDSLALPARQVKLYRGLHDTQRRDVLLKKKPALGKRSVRTSKGARM